jgi:hypothetical protein
MHCALAIVLPFAIEGLRLRLGGNDAPIQVSITSTTVDQITTDPQPIQVTLDANGNPVTPTSSVSTEAPYQSAPESEFKIEPVVNATVEDEAFALNVTLDQVLFCKQTGNVTTNTIFGCVGAPKTTPSP